MKKKIGKFGPVLLSYGCVLIGIIGIILDIVNGKTAEMVFFSHILMVVGWTIVSIKWTRDYHQNANADTENPSD